MDMQSLIDAISGRNIKCEVCKNKACVDTGDCQPDIDYSEYEEKCVEIIVMHLEKEAIKKVNRYK